MQNGGKWRHLPSKYRQNGLFFFCETFCCNMFWISRGAPTWPQQLLSCLSRPQTSVPASVMVNKVFQNRRKPGNLASPTSEADGPTLCSSCKEWGHQSFGFVDVFSSFLQKLFWPTTPYGPWLPGCLLQRRVSEGNICVWCVQSSIFPLQSLTYIAVRINKIQGWPRWKLSEKMADQSVKTSNRQMTGFFPSWQVFPRKLRHWDSQGFKYENYQNANSHTFRSCILNYLMVMPVQPQEIVGLSLLFLLISPILSSLSVNLNYYLTHYHDWFLLACVSMC